MQNVHSNVFDSSIVLILQYHLSIGRSFQENLIHGIHQKKLH
jgi:hypothetical protein